MVLDTIHGTIDRRILLYYRVDPEWLQRALPKAFRPKLYGGYGIGGVCMIRFADLRPRYTPRWLGVGSENAAHRVAVEWEQDGVMHEGVFIPRRDTNSRFNLALGGRVFPTTDAAAGFFSLGATGYSATHDPSHYHGMELHSLNWAVEPLEVDDAASRFFDDRTRFPVGTVELDCALLMRGIEHEWRSRPDLYATSDGASLTVRRT